MIKAILTAIALLLIMACTTSPELKLGCTEECVETRDFSLKQFSAIKIDASRDQVRDLIGVPTCVAGSGISYDVYHLSDGRQVLIAYPDNKLARWAFLKDPKINSSEILFGE